MVLDNGSVRFNIIYAALKQSDTDAVGVSKVEGKSRERVRRGEILRYLTKRFLQRCNAVCSTTISEELGS